MEIFHNKNVRKIVCPDRQIVSTNQQLSVTSLAELRNSSVLLLQKEWLPCTCWRADQLAVLCLYITLDMRLHRTHLYPRPLWELKTLGICHTLSLRKHSLDTAKFLWLTLLYLTATEMVNGGKGHIKPKSFTRQLLASSLLQPL